MFPYGETTSYCIVPSVANLSLSVMCVPCARSMGIVLCKPYAYRWSQLTGPMDVLTDDTCRSTTGGSSPPALAAPSGGVMVRAPRSLCTGRMPVRAASQSGVIRAVRDVCEGPPSDSNISSAPPYSGLHTIWSAEGTPRMRTRARCGIGCGAPGSAGPVRTSLGSRDDDTRVSTSVTELDAV